MPQWPGIQLAARDQATSTSSLAVGIHRRNEAPCAVSHSSSSWAELSEGQGGSGGRTSGLLESGSLGSPAGACWRPGDEPSLLSGVQRMPGSTATVACEGSAAGTPAGRASLSLQQGEQQRLSSSPHSLQNQRALPLPPQSPVLSYLSPSSPRQPSATPFPEASGTSRDASRVSESSSAPSTLTQSSGTGSRAQGAAERSLLERARSSGLFQRSRAWVVSWADALPKSGRGGSLDSGVDVQDIPRRARPGDGGLGPLGAPMNGARAEGAVLEPESGDGGPGEAVICPRETALQPGVGSRNSRPSLWQKWEERPLIAFR